MNIPAVSSQSLIHLFGADAVNVTQPGEEFGPNEPPGCFACKKITLKKKRRGRKSLCVCVLAGPDECLFTVRVFSSSLASGRDFHR